MKKKIFKFNLILLITFLGCGLALPHAFPETSKVSYFTLCRFQVGMYNTLSNRVNAESECKTKAALTFDDGYKCVYDIVYPILEEYEYTASIPIIGSRIGKYGYLDYRELSILYRNGYEILNHSYNHIQDEELSCETLMHEYKLNEYLMSAYGFRSSKNIIIAPGGKYYNNHAEIAEQAGFDAVRTLDGLYTVDAGKLDNICIINVYGSRSCENIKSNIDFALNNDLDIIFVFHRISQNPPESPMYIGVDKFREILYYICLNKISVVPYADLLEE